MSITIFTLPENLFSTYLLTNFIGREIIGPMINTVPELIDQLGGTNAVAALIGVGAPAVSNAKTANHLPHSWRMKIYQEVRRTGIEVVPAILGMSEDDAAKVA